MRLLGLAAWLLILCAGAAQAQKSENKLARFALKALQTTPDANIEDAYKWLFQATQGGEHAAPSREGAARWLDKEWQGLAAPQPGETLITPLTPGGALVRLNLRPYQTCGGAPEKLVDAFLASARDFKADKKAFLTVWQALGTQLQKRTVKQFNFAAWQKLDEQMKTQDYPAVHHSDAYNKAYTPAYRVLTKAQADTLATTCRQR